MIKILIVDDQRLFRHGLMSLLEQERDFKIVGDASDGQEAFTLTQETKPDIILMDVEMPKLDGIGATRMISERYPNMKILMLSVYNEDERVIAAVKAGASGYILKDADHKEFIKIIKSAYAGKSIVSPFLANLTPRILSIIRGETEMPEEMDMDIHKKFSLTERENKILELLLKGKCNKEIADITHVSVETVKSHLKNIYRKLGVNSRLEAVALFLEKKYKFQIPNNNQ